jgi:DNA-binding HxlR family transcriptional regulator
MDLTPPPGSRVRGSTTGRPVMALLDLLGRRHTLRVLWELRHGDTPTFRDLQASCGDISSSVLSRRLHELGESGIVEHNGDGYALTPKGTNLIHLLKPLDAWAQE